MKMLQVMSRDVCAHVFGEDSANNRRERALRFFEEACELARVEGLTKGDMNRLVEFEHGRPPGVKSQEVAGVGLTLLTLAALDDIDVHDVCFNEIRRLLANRDKIRAKGDAKPMAVRAV